MLTSKEGFLLFSPHDELLATQEIRSLSLEICLLPAGENTEIVVSLLPDFVNKLGITKIIPGICVL